MTVDGYYSVEDAAKALGIERFTLYQRIRRKKIPVVRVADVILLSAATVNDLKHNPRVKTRRRV